MFVEKYFTFLMVYTYSYVVMPSCASLMIPRNPLM